MIASAIFLLLLLTLGSMFQKRVSLTIVLFLCSLLSIMLLFWHHATDALNISL
ncbi:MAG: DUF5993 family protein [Phycisphaerales bacterium]|nr:DUF5993 family protein [Phycisphaerales bacterium]